MTKNTNFTPARTTSPKPSTTASPVGSKRLSKEERAKLSPEQLSAYRAARKASRGPASARAVKSVTRAAKRVERLARMFAGHTLAKDIDSAVKVLRNLATDLNELPADWKPATTERTARTAVEVGTSVTIAENKLAEYEEVFGKGQLGGLTVTKVLDSGKALALKSKQGKTLTLPARHVRAVAA